MIPREILLRISEAIAPLYDIQEARSIGRELLERLYGCSRMDLSMNIPLTNFSEKDFLQALNRLEKGEPVQYVTGIAHFYGLDFEVDSHTLIPRPETEELVQLIVDDFEGKPLVSILDIGTGTGCIPIALGKHFPEAQVFALDISDGALAVASRNAHEYGIEIDFFQADVLSEKLPIFENVSVLVSNPPYIRNLEKANMHVNVLDYEPVTALFVPDNDPLLFYRRIAQLGRQWLSDGGWLYFEINEAMGEEVGNLLKLLGYSQISVLADMHGRPRMAKAQWFKNSPFM